MKVYINATSNAPMRVRIAIALKRLDVETVDVDFERGSGDQHAEEFRALNPQAMIPVLVDGGRVITQSLAIIEYLEELYPEPPLLPSDAVGRARVRALALAIACEGQPLVNLRVRQYLERELGLSNAALQRWIGHWMRASFREYESLLAAHPVPGAFSHGDQCTLADACLIPHVIMARRFAVDIDAFPRIAAIFAGAMREPRIAAAVHPVDG